MEEAMEALKNIETNQTQSLTIDKVVDCVCSYYNIKREDLVGKKKNKEIVDPRQMCMFLITELIDVPLMTVGQVLGGRDHTTVIHARDKMSELIKTDKKIQTDFDDLMEILKSQN